MKDFALILNAGSSSLKFSVFTRQEEEKWKLGSRGQIEGIGNAPKLSVKDAEGKSLAKEDLDSTVKDAGGAIASLASWLRNYYPDAHIVGVGHRIVHGGSKYSAPVIVTQKVIDDLKTLIPLAPLHQPYNLAAIEAVASRLPDVPQVACFDTGFHSGHDEVTDLVPLPAEIRAKNVKRYGFHGLSYEYISAAIPDFAPELEGKNIIVGHLGSGVSMCAIKNGKSFDCSLGFTALDGLCMGTRPGSIDPGVVLFLFQNLGMTPEEVETILYKKSGLLGISEISNDMRELLGRDEPAAKLAVDYFVYRAAKEIGALTASMGGLEGLVFTAGIGENSPEIRKRICEASAWLGILLDDELNQKNNPKISSHQSKIPVWVIPTNEELMIARHTAKLLSIR